MHPARKHPTHIHLLLDGPLIYISEPSSKLRNYRKNQEPFPPIISRKSSPGVRKGQEFFPSTLESMGGCREKAPDAIKRERESRVPLRIGLEGVLPRKRGLG
jgi:hypothetical protein